MDLLNNGYYNSQAVQVLNAVEYDEFDNPIGLYESPSDPSSCNFTVSDNSRCKFVDSNCFQGNKTAYCNLTNTISLTGDFDISFSYKRNDKNTVWDSILGHSTNTLNSAVFWIKTNLDFLTELRIIVSNGSSYIHLYSSGTDNIPIDKYTILNIRFTRTNGVVTAYLNNVEYPNTISTPNQTLTISRIFYGVNAVYTPNGKLWNLNINNGGIIYCYPMCENVITPAGHIYHDVSGNGNHATLINGSAGNESRQNEFHYLQKGFNKDYKYIDGNYSNLLSNHSGHWTSSRSGSIFTFNKIASGQDGAGFMFASLRSTFTGDIWQFKFKIRFTQILSSITFQVRAGGASGYSVAAVQQPIINLNLVNTWLDIEFIANVTSQETTSIGIYVVTPTGSYGHTIELDLQSIELLNPNFLPKHLTNNTDYLGNPLEFQQDGKSFLPSGCFLQQYSTNTNLKTADNTVGLWYGPEGDPYKVSYNTLCLQDPWNEQVFIGNKTKDYKLGPISTHYNNLTPIQKLTERVVRDVIDDPLIEDPAFSHDVTVAASDLTYSMNNQGGYTMNGIIDWGDGTTQSVNTTAIQTITKTYSVAGTYTVKFTGTLENLTPIYVSGTNANKVTKINNWGNCGFKQIRLDSCFITSIPDSPITGVNATTLILSNLFTNCTKLSGQIPADLLYYAKAVTSLQNLFNGCTRLTGQIPENLFKYCPNLTSVASAFQGCTGLTGQIPEELLKYNTKLTTVASLFNGCTGLSGGIPINLLKYNVLLTAIDGLFQNCSNLTGTIPAELFKNTISVTTATNLFLGCSKLSGSIPEDLLEYMPAITTLYSAFLGCSLLTGQIPTLLLKYNINVTRLDSLFNNCIGLTGSIPLLLATNTKVTHTISMFAGCTGLTGIPADLLRYCSTVLVDASSMFYNCTGITSIPAGLFDYNTNVTTFASTFRNTRITTIPSNLFVNNTKVTSFSYTFAGNPSLTAIPSNLFDTNTLVTTFDNVFNGCTGITSIPVDLFKYNVVVTNMSGAFSNIGYVNSLSLPSGLFSTLTLVTNMSSLFSNTKLANMPTDMFRYNTNITDFSSAFTNSFISDGMFTSNIFQYNTKVTTFYNAFQGCQFTYIPSNLFDTNTLVTNFSSTFFRCYQLTTIPTDLFRNNTLVSNFSFVFSRQAPGNPYTIPTDIFRYNLEVRTFNYAFSWYHGTALPEDLFYYNTKVTTYSNVFSSSRNIVLPTRMFNTANLGKVASWQNFLNVTSTVYSPTGTIQKIWDVSEGGDVSYIVQPTKTDAFNNCTALSNYAEIPAAWT